MNYGEGGLSASDVALLTNNRSSNGSGDGFFGDSGAWFIILFLIFAIFGWGRNGFGNDNGNGGGACNMGYVPYGIGNAYTDASIQRGFDNQSIMNKLNGLENGLCDGFYAVNTSILNGVNGIQSTLCQGFSGVNNAITTNGYETRLGTQALSSQLANCCCDIEKSISDCCCKTQRGIDQVNYNMAINTNALQQTMCNNTRDILESNNNNTRAILDFLTNDKISTLQSENQALKFQASQTAQNAFITANQEAQTAELIRRLGADCPQPAYVVQPPTPINFPTNCCGQFTGYNYNNCGCNSCC